MQIKNVFLVLALGVSSIAAQAGDQPQLQPRQLDVDGCNDCHQRCRNDRGKQTRSWLMDCYDRCRRSAVNGVGPCLPKGGS
ncbi:uncharacterized protein RSE6_11780 [Rhynchosporium secalis]|uniref:Uncharacterized protein n=1 Tax=Rhynchosporium secalis TaxID=38038 RepID=A0A1E1MNR9_RHYSE|nr:uncharacterized protein RSE6_11780 [Rhynchosporium secalis]